VAQRRSCDQDIVGSDWQTGPFQVCAHLSCGSGFWRTQGKNRRELGQFREIFSAALGVPRFQPADLELMENDCRKGDFYGWDSQEPLRDVSPSP